MFVLGEQGDDVGEYTLSTAFDVSTASFVDSFSVAGQDTFPISLSFSTDGMKMFVLGNTGDDVNEYTLSTAWDVSTSLYIGSFSVAAQETNPTALAFSTDGLKMFVMGAEGDDVSEYTARDTRQQISGMLTASSTLNDVHMVGTAPIVFFDSASTTDLTVGEKATVIAPQHLTISGNYTNNGIMVQAGTTIIDGTAQQIFDGNMTGENAFNDLIVRNISANGTTSQSVHFQESFSVNGLYTMSASTSVLFAYGSNNTLENIDLQGNYGQKIYMRTADMSTINYDIETSSILSNQLSLQKPSRVAPGDMLLIVVGNESIGATPEWDDTTYKPDGFTLINEAGNATSQCHTAAFYRIADGTEYDATTTPSVSSARTYGWYVNVPGAYMTTIDVGADSIVSATSHTIPEVTVTEDNSLAFFTDCVENWAGGTPYGTSNGWEDVDVIGLNRGNESSVVGIFGTKFVPVAGGAGASAIALGSIRGFAGFQFAVHGTTTGARLNVLGTQSVSYVDVKDSNACGGETLYADDGTSVDAGGNTCWDFTSLNMQSNADQSFVVGQETTSMATITIADDDPARITATNDIRIKIATGTVDVRFDTTDTTAIFGGTASGKVSNPVSYEGDGSVLVIPVDTNFAAGDTLTISGLYFTQFGAVTAATSALMLYVDGANDVIADYQDPRTVVITGTLTLDEHSDGQVSDNFKSKNQPHGVLHAFSLAPVYEGARIESVEFDLSGIQGVTEGKITNIRLYQDKNSDSEYDAGDVLVMSAGDISITDQVGTIVFNTEFIASSTEDYILVAGLGTIAGAHRMYVSLSGTDIGVTGSTSLSIIQVAGLVSSVGHFHGSRGGGSAGPSEPVGGPAPEGQGQQGGGEEGGGGGDDSVDPNTGTAIGSSPGYMAPSTSGTPNSGWTGGSDAYASDGVYATAASNGLQHSYGTFAHNVPDSNTIQGIGVKLEASATTNAGDISVRLSWDGGNTWTSMKTTATASTTDAVYTLGGPSDTWGHSWTPTETNDTNFILDVTANTSSNTIRIDAIQVRIFHQATGGGGGGGGAI
jgi:hypothetical protein